LHTGSNLPTKDNLQKEDKTSAPKVSFIWRFHCIGKICRKLIHVGLAQAHPNYWHCSYDNVLNVANIPTLVFRRKHFKLFNIINSNSVFSDSPAARRVSPYLFSIKSTNSTTLSQIFTHTTLFQNSFFPSAISLWNTLPEDVCKTHSLSVLKCAISNVL